MKKCFTFNNYPDCQKLVKHLETIISSTIHIQHGNTITVYDDMYETAVTAGKKYVTKNKINCNWVDTCGQELPTGLVPFAYITAIEDYFISPRCLSSDALPSIKNIIDFLVEHLGREVFMQIQDNGNIVFLIKEPISVNAQLKLVNRILEYDSCPRYAAGSTIIFTDYFGNIIKNNI